jgi:hypothetical protein
MRLDEFLLARIAEQEQRAPEIHHYDCESVQYAYDGIAMGPCDCGEPEHVLAECAAKRAIVKLHAHVEGCGCLHNDQGLRFGCCICHEDQGYILSAGWCDTLLALARVYADHPDLEDA